MFERMRRRLAIVLFLVLAPAALAATSHGITPTAPKDGATVAKGSRPTFRGTVKRTDSTWIIVSASKARDKYGVIGLDDKGRPTDDLQVLQRAKLSGKRFAAKALLYSYPDWWLNKPGTYFWQAHQIHCPQHGKDCYQEGPVLKLRVK